MYDDITNSTRSAEFQGVGLPEVEQPCRVTVLTSNGPSLAKTCRRLRNGTIEWINYDLAKTVSITTHEFANFAELCAFIDHLGPLDQKAIVYGALHPKFNGRVRLGRRLLYRGDDDEEGTLVEAAHNWLIIDFDGKDTPPDGLDPIADPEGAADYVISKLPPEFHGAEHYWRLTAGAGFKPGVRMRLIFPLDREIKNSEAKRWLAKAPVDGSIYGPAQPIYTATPIFEGLDDPVPRRSGFRNGHVVEVPEIPEPVEREYTAAPDRDELEEHDDDPELAAEIERIVANYVRTQGVGDATKGGDHVFHLIHWLIDLRTAEGLVASAKMIFEAIHEDFPRTTLEFIQEKIAKRDKLGTRGCKLIGGEAEDEPAREEEVAEEPRPFLHDPAAHLAEVAARKAELKRVLRNALLSETAVKLLINATMGLGKTWSSMEAIAIDAGPPPAAEEDPKDKDDLLAEDLRAYNNSTGQIVFAAQRHDILREAAGFLREVLLVRGWSEAQIEENIVIGQSRERGLCLRTAEEVKMVAQAHGDLGPSLCVTERKGKEIRCPHYEKCEIRGWLAMKRKMTTARFVFLTHAHLFSPWPPMGGRVEHFHPKKAKLVIVDENFISSAIDSEPTNIKAGTFRELLPADLELIDHEQRDAAIRAELEKDNPEEMAEVEDPKLEMPEEGLGNLVPASASGEAAGVYFGYPLAR